MSKFQIQVGFLSFVFVVLNIILLVAVGVYHFGWQGQTIANFTRVVPLPAAVFQGRIISLSSVYKLEKSYQQLAEKGYGKKRISRKALLEDLIRDQIVFALAKEQNLDVSEVELGRYYRFILKKIGISEEEALLTLEKFLGMSEREFKKKILVPDLLQQKLYVSWLQALKNSQEYRRVLAIQRRLQTGEDFKSVAKNYSEDEESKYLGGDLGFVARDELSPWLADAAFDLETGKISEIVVSGEGYHILQVAVRDQESQPPKIQVRQILIRGFDFQEYLQKASRKFQIWVFEKI